MSVGDPYCGVTKQWWVCLTTTPTFRGCCAEDPCKNNGVCPSDPENKSIETLPATSSQTTTTFITSIVTSVTTATATTTTSRASNNINSNNNSTRDPTEWYAEPTETPLTFDGLAQGPPDTPLGPTIGGALGGFLLLLAIAGIWRFLLRRRERRLNPHPPNNNNMMSVAVPPLSPSPPGYPSPYLLDRNSMQKYPATATTTPYQSPYLPQRGDAAELASSSSDPVELVGSPGSPLMRREEGGRQHRRR